MPNPEHVKILQKGVEAWNQWRTDNPNIVPDLRVSNLRRMNLRRVNLRRANLRTSNLSEAGLSEAYLSQASLSGANLGLADLNESDLSQADLRGADLSRAYLIRCDLRGADLNRVNLRGAHLNSANLNQASLIDADLKAADLRGARLNEADLSQANLSETDLRGADLSQANLREADLDQADLRRAEFLGTKLINAKFGCARLLETSFVDVDLSGVINLGNLKHDGPSTVDRRTLTKSVALPEMFLKGVGFSDWEIENTKLLQPNLLNAEINDIIYRVFDLKTKNPIQIHNLFISYSHENNSFVDALESKLNEKGIRFWRDVHHSVAGPLEEQVALAMDNRTVLLILSEHSVQSDWVEWEIGKVRELAREHGRHVLCPIALDDAWKHNRWEGRMKQQIEKYNILDFSDWKDVKFLDRQFNRLIDGLDIFYKAPSD